MVSSGLLLALAGLAAAVEDISGYSVMRNPTVDFVDGTLDAVNLARDVNGCEIGMKSCDINYCVPLSGVCCAVGDGKYCPAGKYCVSGGCCPIGKLCRPGSGASTCGTNEAPCGKFCMEAGGSCCNPSTGQWCDPGKTCVNGGTQCSLGGSSGGGGGGGSGGFPSSIPSGGSQSTSVVVGSPVSSDILGGSDGSSTSYSLSPVATSDSGSDSGSGPFPTRASGSNPTGNSGSGNSQSPSAAATTTLRRPPGAGAGAANAPNLLLLGALLAAAPLLL